MKPSEFNEITDNSPVHLLPMLPFLEQVKVATAEAYKTGEPREIRGAKFGRINKKYIDQFPVIEEDLKAFTKRISETDKQPK